MTYEKLVVSRLHHKKLRLNNSIVLYVSRPKCDMLPFEDELDAKTSRILNSTECDRDDEEYLDEEDLKFDNPELHSSPKRKRRAITR